MTRQAGTLSADSAGPGSLPRSMQLHLPRLLRLLLLLLLLL